MWEKGGVGTFDLDGADLEVDPDRRDEARLERILPAIAQRSVSRSGE